MSREVNSQVHKALPRYKKKRARKRKTIIFKEINTTTIIHVSPQKFCIEYYHVTRKKKRNRKRKTLIYK